MVESDVLLRHRRQWLPHAAREQLIGMSQTVLAERLGLTFQQVQKYERGANRLSTSALWRAADAVDVPVSYLFDGLRRRRATPGDGELDVVILKLTQRMRSLEPAVREVVQPDRRARSRSGLIRGAVEKLLPRSRYGVT